MAQDNIDARSVAERRANFRIVSKEEVGNTDGQVMDVLSRLGHFERAQVTRNRRNSAYKFGYDVVSSGASVVAVATIDSIEKEREFSVSEFKLEADKLKELKDKYNISINSGEDPEGESISRVDFKWGELVVPGGLYIPRYPERSFSEDKIQEYNEAYSKIPDDVKTAVEDYLGWYWGEGKYEGGTGIKLESALLAGLLTQEQFDAVIEAKSKGQSIITNDESISTNDKFKTPFVDFAEKDIDYPNVTVDAWAIIPSQTASEI